MQRVLELSGASNFRDFGGYSTLDGRHARWGVLFRSNKLSTLTPADEEQIDHLHIVAEVDLRSAKEREQEPDRWLHPPAQIYQSPKHNVAMNSVFSNVKDEPTAREAMQRFYAHAPDDYRPEFAALFRHLAAGEEPMLVHCTAGKDRTGVAVAILLSALGVPRATIVADYVMSETLLKGRFSYSPHSVARTNAFAAATGLSQLPSTAQAEISRSEPSFVLAALHSIDIEYGSVDAYIRRGLGLTDRDIEELRSRLTE